PSAAYKLECPGPMPADASSPSARASRDAASEAARRSAPERSDASAIASRSSEATCGHEVAVPSPATRPLGPSTSTKYGDPATPYRSHARVDMTSGTPSGASSSSFDGLSSSVSLVTITTRASPGMAGEEPRASQNAPHPRHPLDRNASSVDPWAPTTATFTASPDRVSPPTPNAS